MDSRNGTPRGIRISLVRGARIAWSQKFFNDDGNYGIHTRKRNIQ